MKKLFRSFLIVVLGICLALSVSACGKADFSYGEDYEKYGVTLDRYEELDLVPVDGNADGITITTADASIVGVEGNRLIANSEGETTITAKRNGGKKTLTVYVVDTGAKPKLGVDSDIIYIGADSDVGAHVVYNKKDYAHGANYEYSVPAKYADYVEVVNGKLRGKEGADGKTVKVDVKLEGYKGREAAIKGQFTFRVRPASFIDTEAELDVYAAEDSRLANVAIVSDVHYNAKKIEDANLTYEVVEGGDYVTVDENGVVSAKNVLTENQSGSAVIAVRYATDASIETRVSVNVHPNYVATNFVEDPAKYALATSVPAAAKNADGAPEKIYAYTQPTGDTWTDRISFNDAGSSIVANARKGYKYFGYDLYFDGTPLYIGLDHADCQGIKDGQYFRSDYMKIVDVASGRVTNRLVKGTWVRLVYDLFYYVENTSYVAFSETGFFYAQSGAAGSKTYMGNVRWYLDDNFGSNVHAPEGSDYVLDNDVEYKLNADGSISASNNEWTFDNTSNKIAATTYAPAEGEIGGVSGAWKYAPVDDGNSGEWQNQLTLISAAAYKNGPTGDTGYNVNGMLNLTEAMPTRVGATVTDDVATKYKFLTFDMYIENGSYVNFNVNQSTSGRATGARLDLGTTKETYVEGGTDLDLQKNWIKVWEKDSDKLSYYMEKGKWYTVSIAYFDNYSSNNWASNIILSAKGGSVIYLNDVKFRKDNVAPTEYEGFQPVNIEITNGKREMQISDLGDDFTYQVKYKMSGNKTAADIVWESSNTSVANVDDNGLITFDRDGLNGITYITATVEVAEGVTVSDSFEVKLVDFRSSHLAPSFYVDMSYDPDDDNTAVLKTTVFKGSANQWDSTLTLTDIATTADKPVSKWRTDGYKYLALDVYFGEGASGLRSYIHLNTGSGSADYGEITVGSNAPAANAFVYDAETKIRELGTIAANKWYTVYIATDYSNYNPNWAKALINFWAKEGEEGTFKIRNIAAKKDRSEMFDVLQIAGAPSSTADTLWNDIKDNEYQLSLVNSSLEVEWSVRGISSDAATIVSIDENGLLTFSDEGLAETVKRRGLFEVTATPKDTRYASLTGSVTFAIINDEYDAPINTWHLCAKNNTEWQSNTGDEFALSWKFTGNTLQIAGFYETTDEDKLAARAQYITFDMYFKHAAGINYESDMYSEHKRSFAWFWGNSVRPELMYYGASSGLGRFVKIYDMDGNAVAKVTTGNWYKIVLPNAMESSTSAWGTSRFIIDSQKVDGVDKREVYFRNVSYGDTLPSGLYDLKITGAPTANVYLESGNYQLGVETNAGAVEWRSSDNETATVDQNGRVTFLKTGSVTIYVKPTDAARASLERSVTLTIVEESIQILTTDTTKEWRSLPANKQVAIEYTAAPSLTLNWSVADESATYATVDQNGVVTFLEAGRYHDITINVTSTSSKGEPLSASVTFKLNDTVNSHFTAGNGITLEYVSATDTNEITATTSSSGTINLIDIVKGTSPVASWQNNGYKYFVTDVKFNEGVKNLESRIWLNKGDIGDVSYFINTITVGSADPLYYATVYDGETKERVTGKIEANHWYTVFIETRYNNPHTWTQAYLTLRAKSGETATATFKNVGAIKGEVLKITGKPSRDVNISELDNGELQLGVTATEGLDLEWTVNVAEDVATVDNTGKLTLKKPADSLTVTVTGKKDGKVIMSDSATFKVVEEWSTTITNKPTSLDWNDLADGKTFTLDVAKSKGLTLEYSSDNEAVAVENGVLTFAPAAIGQDVTITVNGMLNGVQKATDSVVITLEHAMRQFSVNANTELSYGTDSEVDTVLISSTVASTDTNWDNAARLTDLSGSKDYSQNNFFKNGKKYVKLDVSLSSNGKITFNNWYTNDQVSPKLQGEWYNEAIEVGKTTKTYLYDVNGVRVYGNVKADTQYVVYVPILWSHTSNSPRWGEMRFMVRTTDENSATVKVKNIEYVTAIENVYDEKVQLTGVPNSSVIFAEGGTNTVQLGTRDLLEAYEGVAYKSSNNEIATVTDEGLVTFLQTGTVEITVSPKNAKLAPLATTVTLKAVTAEEKQAEWHFASTATTWQTEGEFANSWKFSGENLTVASSLSAESNANYIYAEIYFAKAVDVYYYSDMYSQGKTTNWWSAIGGTTINENTMFFDMSGNRATSLELGKWYKMALKKAKEGANVTWQCYSKLIIGKDTNGEAEVYFRNAAYGSTIPEGWVNA